MGTLIRGPLTDVGPLKDSDRVLPVLSPATWERSVRFCGADVKPDCTPPPNIMTSISGILSVLEDAAYAAYAV